MSTNDYTLHEQNFLTSSRGTLMLSGLPDVSFTLTQYNLPGVSTSSARYPTPFTDIPFRGDTLVFNPLVVEFIVLEDLSNWQELFNWIVGITAPTNPKEFTNKPHEYMDGILIAHSSHNNPIFEIDFKNLVITDISDIQFNTTDSDSQHMTCTATLDYQNFELRMINSKHKQNKESNTGVKAV